MRLKSSDPLASSYGAACFVAAMLLVGCGSSAQPSLGDTAAAASRASITPTALPTVALGDVPDAPFISFDNLDEQGLDEQGLDEFPEIVGAKATMGEVGQWSFEVTVSSPYDTPDRYADAWRVLDGDDIELGVRELSHDHAGEQPFTRDLSDVAVPDDVVVVFIEGRDLINGWSGQRFALELTAG